MVYSSSMEKGPVGRSEVDSTESLWYRRIEATGSYALVLKLTPPSHYGIGQQINHQPPSRSEVDSTESLWYTMKHTNTYNNAVLKLTPPSHYGISV